MVMAQLIDRAKGPLLLPYCALCLAMDTIVHKVGEWFPLFDENSNLLWDYMAHAWKINYHTVRSMIQTEKRLKKIVESL